MNTLTSAPVAPLLERLFRQADQTDAALPAFSAEERERLMRSKTDYPDLYARLQDLSLAGSRRRRAHV